jgi:hypothetical protein
LVDKPIGTAVGAAVVVGAAAGVGVAMANAAKKKSKGAAK